MPLQVVFGLDKSFSSKKTTNSAIIDEYVRKVGYIQGLAFSKIIVLVC